MSELRRALLFTATERFIVISVNFVVLAILARLLSPEEIGYSAIGAATLGIVESFRDFGATGFIVQQPRLTREDTRTAATVMLLLSVAVTVCLWFASGPLALFYHKDGLKAYLQVTALTFLAGPVSGPLIALLRRDMNFASIAIINIVSASATALTTLALATAGVSYMSFAWGAAAGASTAAVLAMMKCRQHWVFRPTLAHWRNPMVFGLYTSGAGLLGRATDALPALVLGRTLGFDVLGLYSRAVMVCQLPDKVLLTGLLPVALPAMAAEVRAGRNLKMAYLRGLSFISVVQWPALVLLAVLAHPAVTILLGGQWTAIVPLVRIMALAALAGAPNVLFYSTLVAVGAVRDALWCTAIMLPVNVAAVGIACRFGVTAVAWSLFAVTLAQSTISVSFIRLHVHFAWRDFIGSMTKSAVVTACSAAAPLITLSMMGSEISMAAAALIAAEALGGWVCGLVITSHPLCAEVRPLLTHVAAHVNRRPHRARPAGLGRQASSES